MTLLTSDAAARHAAAKASRARRHATNVSAAALLLHRLLLWLLVLLPGPARPAGRVAALRRLLLFPRRYVMGAVATPAAAPAATTPDLGAAVRGKPLRAAPAAAAAAGLGAHRRAIRVGLQAEAEESGRAK